MKKNAVQINTELDPIGQYYASVITPDHPGQFMLSAYLHETVDPAVLQRAVGDVMRRLPFLCGRLDPKFFSYHHKLLVASPQIVWMEDGQYLFSDYYNQGDGHVLRVLYGKYHITLEAIHSILDGRGLRMALQTLLVRYFELLGASFAKGNFINCDDDFQAEEWEDAYVRYDAPESGLSGRGSASYPPSYHHGSGKTVPAHVVLKSFDLTRLKCRAKAHGATLSEYILAQIFLATAKERNARSCSKIVTALVPIDCRSFFPSKTLRSFVDSLTITMPETEDLAEMVAGVRAAFGKIDAELVQAKINEFQGLKRKGRFFPRVVKKWILRRLERSEGDGLTTTFSNLGLVPLPPEIEARVARVAFIIDAAQDMPITYAAASIGRTLTLAFTLCIQADEIVQTIVNMLEEEE